MAKMNSRPDYEFKIVTLGEGRVGKTSLLLKYVRNVFHDKEAPSLQANFQDKSLNIEGSRVQLHIWDTAGQERYRAIARNYYRDAQGALIVYDITEPDSFERVKQWANELAQYGEPGVSITIVGNKSDLEAGRRVSREEAVRYARSMGATHYDTSAKSGRGVAEMFEALGRAALLKARASREGTSGTKSRGVTISHAENKKKEDCTC